MLERIETQTTFPQTIHLTLTRECNIDCKYCKSDTEQACPELTTVQWFDLIDGLTEKYGRVCMIVKGGEPLVREDFFDIVSYIKSKGHYVSLVTNGTLISDMNMAQRLESYVDHMEISLDGIAPETTDVRKDQDVFDRIMTGIDLVHHTGIELGVSFMILDEPRDLLWKPLEDFIKTYTDDGVAIRNDNTVNFPVDLGWEPNDFCDFLRSADKQARQGKAGSESSATELEIDPGGFLHPYSPVAPEPQVAMTKAV